MIGYQQVTVCAEIKKNGCFLLKQKSPTLDFERQSRLLLFLIIFFCFYYIILNFLMNFPTRISEMNKVTQI